MQSIRCGNVNEMLPYAMVLLQAIGERSGSRDGDVIVAPHPVISVYERPTERVLFCPKRDANPFFHLVESLWMLAGRDDAATLTRYVKRFEQYAEHDGTIHDAYGYRWRTGLGTDQLNYVVDKLRKQPDTRQCVIQMWDIGPENWHIGSREMFRSDLTGDWRTRPCNTHVYLRVYDKVYPDTPPYSPGPTSQKVLDLTVLCRSNDIVMGAYGANAVQFSVLQEYLAGRIGVGVGTMYQFSNNWHGYVRDLDRLGDPEELDCPNYYEDGRAHAEPMGDRWSVWDNDLKMFMDWHDACAGSKVPAPPHYVNAWFHTTATHVVAAHWHHRAGDHEAAAAFAHSIGASDWRRACVDWLARRAAK